jgi:hypothetical protein
MTNNKQLTAVDIERLASDYALNRGISKGVEQRMIDGFVAGYNKAKEMEKERMIEFAKQFIDVVNIEDKDIEIIYEQTYGGGEQ